MPADPTPSRGQENGISPAQSVAPAKRPVGGRREGERRITHQCSNNGVPALRPTVERCQYDTGNYERYRKPMRQHAASNVAGSQRDQAPAQSTAYPGEVALQCQYRPYGDCDSGGLDQKMRAIDPGTAVAASTTCQERAYQGYKVTRRQLRSAIAAVRTSQHNGLVRRQSDGEQSQETTDEWRSRERW